MVKRYVPISNKINFVKLQITFTSFPNSIGLHTYTITTHRYSNLRDNDRTAHLIDGCRLYVILHSHCVTLTHTIVGGWHTLYQALSEA